MIDQHLTGKLHQWLASQGAVESLTPIPSSEHHSCMVLATMQSQEDARRIQQQFGFTMFGYTSLIIADDWLRQHLQSE
jgi:hypothetical protein